MRRIEPKRSWMVPLVGMMILLSALSWLVVWASMVDLGWLTSEMQKYL